MIVFTERRNVFDLSLKYAIALRFTGSSARK
jgi:hypothetical protein